MAVRSKSNTCRWLVAGLLGLALYVPAPAAYAASIETGFSPEGTALQLVLKTIGVSLDIENYCTVNLFFEKGYL